ncbi:hypothetical protein NDU88_005376 [Pleurodeles waltl]|uniref:Uncharacterized protein n=1 Tax=Pleurodeles waltl TaxID=8319 RepID=A0AAV7PIP0_PLEWA|nr:hypothetical protein NDU88_005376 [Pleurodeles waltl]
MDCHRRKLLILQDKNQGLQYQIEDLENRSRCPNIQIKGVPAQAVTGTQENFVVRLFRHKAPALKEQHSMLDRTHRADRPARTPGQAQNILTCLHHYKQREVIMAAVPDTTSIEFEGHRIGLYQDLSMRTLQRCRLFRPVTELLREEGIRYKWGHPFRLHFTWQNDLRSIRTLEEAQRPDGMVPNLEDRAQKATPQVQLLGTDKGIPKTSNQPRKTHKLSMAESQKERAALLRSRRSQDSIPEVDSDQ